MKRSSLCPSAMKGRMTETAQSSSTGRRAAPASMPTTSGTVTTDQKMNLSMKYWYQGEVPNEAAPPMATLTQA